MKEFDDAPPLFVFAKVSSLGPAIKKFNRDVVRYLRDNSLEFLDVYGENALSDFAPEVLDAGKISPLALEFVRVTGLGFGDVYPNVLDKLGALGPMLAIPDDDEEDAA